MHWLTEPGTSMRRRKYASPSKHNKELSQIHGVRNFRLSYRTSTDHGRSCTAFTSGRTGSASIQRWIRQDAGRCSNRVGTG